MIASLPNSSSAPAAQDQDTDVGSTGATHTGVAAGNEPTSLPPETDLETARRRVFHLALASHYGHARIARIADDEAVRTLAEAVARQRYTQCRALAAITFPDGLAPSASPDEARDVQAAWIRAGHALLQGDLAEFRSHLTGAENRLEDALLDAAMLIREEQVSHQFLDFSLSVYGARLRWEELCDRRLAPATMEW